MTHLNENEISYLVGNKKVSSCPMVPFNNLLVEFLNDFSIELRSSQEATDYPDIKTFAFWCRKTNIIKLKTDYEDGKARLGLGLVFHITPTNVPINFAYSFVFGLLSGNANIVRVPSKPFSQIDIVCSAINRIFNNTKYNEIKAMNAFINYEQNETITGKFTASCDARILWGGDVAIRNLRKLPISERCVEIAFADKYSFCVMDAPTLIKLEKNKLKRLAESFYNDTYLMDQNACSSPHLIIWLGREKEEAKERFWNEIYKTIEDKYQFSFVNAMDKYTFFCLNSIKFDNIKNFKNHKNYIYRLTLENLPENIDALRGNFGYFYEYDTEDINDVSHIVNTKYQTLTYFGLDKSQLLDFVVNNRLSGIDRIVPVGQALDIGVTWDGYDIVKSLSRIIDVQ